MSAEYNNSTGMRALFLSSVFFLAIISAACVSIPAELQLLNKSAANNSVIRKASCNKEQMIRFTDKLTTPVENELDPDRISVLNWNVYKGQRDNWEADFQRYSDMHDILIIQEAHMDNGMEELLDKAYGYWTLNAAFYLNDSATGVMTASKVKPLYSCGQRTAEPLIRLPKTGLISYYPVDGEVESLLVANLHGINYSYGIETYKYQLNELYEAMKHHQGPMILAGDFNTWSDERMQVLMEYVDRLSLSALDYTSHNHTRTLVLGNALDHVFYRGLEVVDQNTWTVTSSDHNPISAGFRIKPRSVNDVRLAEK